MRKVIFTLMILAVTALTEQSHAQEKGRFWVGGSIGTSNSRYTDTNKEIGGNQYSIYPEFGYAFSDCWAVGMLFGIGRNNAFDNESNNTSVLETKVNILEFAPFVRYTVFKWKAFRFFVDGGLSYIKDKRDQNRFDNDTKIGYSYSDIDQYGIFLDPGVSVRLSPRIMLTGRIIFFGASYKNSASDTWSSYDDVVTHATDKNFSTSLNSPFNFSNIDVGINFHF